MKYFGSVRTKTLFWLLGAIAACCATYLHFVYGNSVWALTDIPFVVLFIIAFFETVRGVHRPRDAEHEGQFLGSTQKSTGVVQQTYDQHQTLDNPSGSTVQRLTSEGTAHTLERNGSWRDE
jgi:hypothetical protein